MLINKRESLDLKYFEDPKAFIETFNNSSDMNDIYGNIVESNPNKKRKILIIFDDIIV